MGLIKALFEKWTCKHEWETKVMTEYTTGRKYLFICKKCGKMKIKWV